MRRFAAMLCVLVGLLPFWIPEAPASPSPAAAPEATTTPRQEAEAPEEEQPAFDAGIRLRILSQGTLVERTLEEYLWGVVLAEMPTDFPEEALRAQAVASRTFALRKAASHKHPTAQVCTDSACCQGWADPQTFDETARAAALAAVRDTDGLVVAWGEELIDATFFSCSGGRTEAAEAVWGGEVVYLQSVASPGEEDAPRYEETVSFTPEDFAARILALCPEVELSGSPGNWFGALTRSEGGGVLTLEIGGQSLRGTALRAALGLRSTDFDLAAGARAIVITTHGYGHRVGLSQYGAAAMARQGHSFDQILLHYYTGCALRRLYLA